MPELRSETMTVNMGPQHPSTHGVLRLVLRARRRDDRQGRHDHRLPAHRHREDRRAEEVAAGHPARRAHGLPRRAVELAGLLPVGRAAARRRGSMPERVQGHPRAASRSCSASTAIWSGSARTRMEVGAVSVMMYCFRERELLLNINEMIAGFRMFPSYIRIGGLREDLPRGFHEAVTRVPRRVPGEARRVRRPADQEPDLAEAHAAASA